MECFPSKCTIDFEITQKPCLPLTRKAFSETEGRLIISVDENIIFNEEDILLAEFYLELVTWVSQGCTVGFRYDSMDYEESPVLEARIKRASIFISSIWLNENFNLPIEVGKQQFIDAVKLFIYRFESELPDIKQFIN